MQMLKKITLACGLLITLPSLVLADVKEYQFDNGLKLIVKPDHRAPVAVTQVWYCLLYTSPSPRDRTRSRMPSSA